MNVIWTLYERYMDYKNAKKQLINLAIKNFNWGKSFEGKNVHD